MTTDKHDRKEGRSANTGLAKVAVQCSADTLVVNQSLVLRINIYGENRHHCQYVNRWWQAFTTMKQTIYTLFIILILTSCSVPRHIRTTSYQNDIPLDNGEPITQSLFNDKNSTISEENIQKVLDGSIKLPQQLRIAVVRVDNSSQNRRYYWNDEQYLKTQQAYLDLFTDNLGSVKLLGLVTNGAWGHAP